MLKKHLVPLLQGVHDRECFIIIYLLFFPDNFQKSMQSCINCFPNNIELMTPGFSNYASHWEKLKDIMEFFEKKI